MDFSEWNIQTKEENATFKAIEFLPAEDKKEYYWTFGLSAWIYK